MTPEPRVLVVDTASACPLADLAAALRDRGIKVTMATTIEVALERVRAAKFDLAAVSEALVHDEPGDLGFLQALKREAPALGCVIVAEAATGEPGVIARDNIGAILAAIPERAPLSEAQKGAPLSTTSKGVARSPLAEVLRQIGAEARTGSLYVSSSLGTGELHFVEGTLIDAAFLRLEGEKAVYRMFAATEATFSFSQGLPRVLRRLCKTSDDLITGCESERARIEAARLRLGDTMEKVLVSLEIATEGLTQNAAFVHERLRNPLTVPELLNALPLHDSEVLEAIAELEGAGRLKRLARVTERVPLAGVEQLHLMRAFAARGRVPGYDGPTRVVIAGTSGRLAGLAHAALCIVDAVVPSDPIPMVPTPYPIARVKLGDGVGIELVAIPLVPAYAPLWPMALAGAAVVVRLDEAASQVLEEACRAADLPLADALMLVGDIDESNPTQVAALVRAALESLS